MSNNLYKSNIPEKDEFGFTLLTIPYIMKICDERDLYTTPEANKLLYLHKLGIKTIQNLDKYINVQCIYFNENCIYEIQNLDKLTKMQNLILSNNRIKEISGLENLVNLRALDLEGNQLRKISGLRNCVLLENLNVSKNDFDSVDNILELKHNSKLKTLNIHTSDIKEHHVEDPDKLVQLLKSFPDLRVIYLYGNEILRNIKNYRKLLSVQIANITYLDDRPIKDTDKRKAQAFFEGGLEAERKANEEIQHERIYAYRKNTPYWKRIRENIDKRYGVLFKDEDTTKAALGGSAQGHDGDRAMEVLTSNMSEAKRRELDSQIAREKYDNNLVFTEDDLKFENYNNIEDTKFPVDQELLKSYKRKLGLLDKYEVDADTKGGAATINDVKGMIKNNQGVKRMNKQENTTSSNTKNSKDTRASGLEEKTNYADYMRNTSDNELDKIDKMWNNSSETKEKMTEDEGNERNKVIEEAKELLVKDKSVKKKKVIIEEIEDSLASPSDVSLEPTQAHIAQSSSKPGQNKSIYEKEIDSIKLEYSYLLYKLTLFYKFNFSEVRNEFNRVTEHKYSHLNLEDSVMKECFRDEFAKSKKKTGVQPHKEQTTSEEWISSVEVSSDNKNSSQNLTTENSEDNMSENNTHTLDDTETQSIDLDELD